MKKPQFNFNFLIEIYNCKQIFVLQLCSLMTFLEIFGKMGLNRPIWGLFVIGMEQNFTRSELPMKWKLPVSAGSLFSLQC